ncbi:MAG: MgtC/SapB family protein [Bdellovibrionales bacterium]
MTPDSYTYILDIMKTWHTAPDLIILSDMFMALVFGFLFGYERSYHGRAAGMRTYGIVCMVAAALTSSSLHMNSAFEFIIADKNIIFDPTRTIQGIVTGVGFLGAGIIMKDGLRISGLTTAASVWASAAIGIVVGSGFYVCGLGMTLLAMGFVMLGPKFDEYLPARQPLFVSLQFRKGFSPNSHMVHTITNNNGYKIARNSVVISSHDGQVEWRFVAVDEGKPMALADLADALGKIEGLDSFHVARARN